MLTVTCRDAETVIQERYPQNTQLHRVQSGNDLPAKTRAVSGRRLHKGAAVMTGSATELPMK